MKLIDKDNNRITPLGIAVFGGSAILFVLIMKLLVLKFAIWFMF